METRREPLGIENDGVLAGRRFLIAEDNAINAEILCGLLELQGAKFTVTKNGARWSKPSETRCRECMTGF